VGTIDDIENHTDLDRNSIHSILKELLAAGKIEVLMENPQLFKWQEKNHFEEGMSRQEIKL
jgi:hypothetical protein